MDKNKKIWIIVIFVVLIILAVGLYFYGRSLLEDPNNIIMSTIWDAPAHVVSGGSNLSDAMDIENSSRRVQNARKGFLRGLQNMDPTINVKEYQISEGSDVGRFTTNIANIYSEDDIILTVGATTDEASMYASMEMNFFEIPMLIPFADGDLSSSNSDTNYFIRMTPNAQIYADFVGEIFSRNIFDYIYSYLFENRPAPGFDFDVAVLFTDNFNGHDTAVKVTQKVMDNGFNVSFYEPFSKDMLLSKVNNLWNENEKEMEELTAVIILGEDQDPLYAMNDVWHSWADRGLYPAFVMLGHNPDVVPAELAEASNIFVVQQALDMSSCPSDIQNRSEAMGYAAGTIVSRAFGQANNAMKNSQQGFFKGFVRLFQSPDKRLSSHQAYLSNYRSAVRSAILALNDPNIPCYGNAYFNTDVENRIDLELVHYTSVDHYVKVDKSVIFNRIINDVRSLYNITDR